MFTENMSFYCGRITNLKPGKLFAKKTFETKWAVVFTFAAPFKTYLEQFKE